MKDTPPDIQDETQELHQKNKQLRETAELLEQKLATAEKERVKLEHKLEVNENRKINRFLDGTNKLRYKRTRKEGIQKILHSYKKLKTPPPTALVNTYQKAPDPNRSHKTISSRAPQLPNMRVLSVADVPTLRQILTPVIIEKDWQDKLRPDIHSVDAVVLELPKDTDDYPTKLALELLESASEAKVPSIVMAHSDKQLKNESYTPLISKCNVIVTTHLSARVKPAKNQKHVDMSGLIDPTAYNPIGWMREPIYELQVIGENSPSDDDKNAYRQFIKDSNFNSIDIYAPQSASKDFKERFYATKELDTAVYGQSKSYRATMCLPSMFHSYASFQQAVLQLLACGTHVLTTDKKIVSHIDVPHLHMLDNAQNTVKLLSDIDQREKASIQGRREILDASSIFAGASNLLKSAGVSPDTNHTISIILSTNRPDFIDHAIKNVQKQNYPDKELVMVLHGDDFDQKKITKSLDKSGLDYRLVHCPASTIFGEALNAGLDASTGYYVTKFDDDDHYGENHLTDLAIAYQYAQVEVVGKWGHLVYLEDEGTMLNYQTDRQERYVNHLPGGTFLIRRSLLAEFRFGRVRNAIDTELWYRIKEAGGQLYSTHRFNYVRVRHGDNTWAESDQFFKERSDSEVSHSGPEVGFI